MLVVTHQQPSESPEDGVYTFVTYGNQSALQQPRGAAGDDTVTVMGEANLGRQYLVDEVSVHLMPVLFGSGLRLFEQLSEHVQLELAEVVDTPAAVHLRYRGDSLADAPIERNRQAHGQAHSTSRDLRRTRRDGGGSRLAELHTLRFTGASFDLVTVAESREPITSMGGVRMLPYTLLADLEPTDSDLLVLPGAEIWDGDGGDGFAAPAGRFVDAGVPVAAICGATAGLAQAGLLDERSHTSDSAEYLAMTGYGGGDRFVNERAVVDGDLITAGSGSPVQFATATLGRLGLASERTLAAYEDLFHRGDPAAFPVLMETRGGGQ
jgi:putative intracellular protease/amidase